LRELLKHPYNCGRRTKSPQTPMPEILQPAPEIRNRRGLFMVAFLFAGQGTRPPVRREEKGRKKVRVWVQDSNQEPCGFEPGIPAGRALKSGGAAGARGHCKEGRSAPPTLVPPAWGVPAWRGWAHCGALWCFPHWQRPGCGREKNFKLRCLQATLVLPASECAARSSNRFKPWQRVIAAGSRLPT
jgi:hypothetical protein